jgi:DNA-binding ferritin-like protein (Dps family)
MPKVAFNHEYFTAWAVQYTDIETLKKEAKLAFKGINQDNMFKKSHAMLAFFDKIVTLVERAAIDFSTMQSVDAPTGKKKLDIAVEFLDKVIELPFYLEWLDGKILKFLLSWSVGALNSHIGDNWEEKVEI